jgi:hypothetical protein
MSRQPSHLRQRVYLYALIKACAGELREIRAKGFATGGGAVNSGSVLAGCFSRIPREAFGFRVRKLRRRSTIATVLRLGVQLLVYRLAAEDGLPAVQLLPYADVLTLWCEVTKRKAGEDQPRDPDTGRMLPIVDNIHERQERPTGTSAAAGIRKLQKADAEGNEKAEVELH